MSESFEEEVTRIAKRLETMPQEAIEAELDTIHLADRELAAALRVRLDATTMAMGAFRAEKTAHGGHAPTHSEKIRRQTDVPLVGMEIGGCKLEGLIAEGGMGAVFEATQQPMGRKVAVKLMKNGLVSREARQRFDYEAKLVANLAHPGVAQVFGSGVCESERGGVAVPYIIMELVADARSLREFVREEHLGVNETCELFVQVCEAVFFAHQHGIIHRDLKPANILVGADGRPRVIDFGVAHVEDDANLTRSFETNPGSIVGTLPYMSPEQVGGDEVVDVRSDEYTLGVILYELLCGFRPYNFDQKSLPQAIEVIRGVAPQRPSKSVPSLAGDLDTIILKSMRKDRKDRYQTVDDFAEDIRRYLGGLPIEARPTTMGYQVRLFTRRNRLLVTLSLIFVVGLIVATVFSVNQAISARESENKAVAAAREATQSRDMARDSESKAKAAALEATRSRDQALRLLAETRSLAEWLVIDLLNEVAALPGSTPLAEKLAIKVADHLDTMAPDAALDPEMQRTIALAYMEIGSVMGTPTRPNLGKRKEALVHLAKAESRFLKRWEEDPSPRRTIDLCVAQSLSAEILDSMGDTDEARKIYEVGMARLLAIEPQADLKLKRDSLLASFKRDMAMVWAKEGKPQQAIDALRDVVKMRSAVIAAGKNDGSQKRQLIMDKNTLAQLLGLNGQAQEAEALLRATMPEVLASEKEGNIAAEDGAVIRFQLADALSVQKGKEKEALDLFLEVLAIRQALSVGDETNISRMESLATVLERCSTMTAIVTGDNSRAFEYVDRTVAITRHMLEISPDSLDHVSRLRISLGRKAGLANILKRKEIALAASEESFAMAKKLFNEMPDSLASQRAMAESWTLKGHVFLNKPGQADSLEMTISCYEQALVAFQEGNKYLLKLKNLDPTPFWVARSFKAQQLYISATKDGLANLKKLINK